MVVWKAFSEIKFHEIIGHKLYDLSPTQHAKYLLYVDYFPTSEVHGSRIHERTISLMFLGIILRVLRLEVSLYNVYIQTSFKPFLLGEGGRWE